jgi:hypothetical protein
VEVVYRLLFDKHAKMGAVSCLELLNSFGFCGVVKPNMDIRDYADVPDFMLFADEARQKRINRGGLAPSCEAKEYELTSLSTCSRLTNCQPHSTQPNVVKLT